MSVEWHPVIPLIIAFAAMPLVGDIGRKLLSVVAPLIAVGMIIGLPADLSQSVTTLGHEFELLRVERISRLFAFAFALYGVFAGLYAWSERSMAGKAWSMLLVVGGVGVSLAGDWLSLFLFWEMLSIASMFLVWIGRDPQSQAAGFRYAMFHMAGGVVLLGGVLWQVNAGDPGVAALDLEGGPAWLILIGLVTNAAVPPLHAWLPDAYPRASIFGTVFLAAFTTKSAVYVLAQAFPGAMILAWAGAIMTVYGVVFAVLENDMRRLLGYHIISQVGYMVCGVGVGTALAVNGSSAHAFCHIFYKGLLLMAVGAVIHATGRGKLSELGNLARPLRWTFLLMLIGGFSISGVPLFNGFTSKALVISGAVKAHLGAIEMLLVVASMGTFLSVGLKLPWFAFMGADHGAKVERRVPRTMYAAMILSAALCIFTGIPGGYQYLYDHLPTKTLGMADPAVAHHGEASHEEEKAHPDAPDHAAETHAAAPSEPADAHAEGQAAPADSRDAAVIYYPPYTPDHIIGSLQLLLGTALGFFLLLKILKPKPKLSLDVDRFYRRPVALTVNLGGAVMQGVGVAVESAAFAIIRTFQDLVIRARRWGATLSIAHQLAVIVAALVVVAYIALALIA